MTIRTAAFGTVLFLGASTVCAQFYTGHQLKQSIESKSSAQAIGYVAGVFDIYARVSICPPTNITLGQATDLVHRYLNEHPQSLHQGAGTLVHTALKTTWPCPEPANPEARPSGSKP